MTKLRGIDLSDMPKLTITFREPFAPPHLSIRCNPPFADANPIFEAVAAARIRPYALAIEHGAISEESALKIYAQAYAEGVIDRSLDIPYDKYTILAWERWLLANPDHFKELREHVDCRTNWPHLPKEEPHVDGLQHAG